MLLGTELAYVREKLRRCTPAERAEIARYLDIHEKTLKRIAANPKHDPRSMTVGRLALHFKTREKRSQ